MEDPLLDSILWCLSEPLFDLLMYCVLAQLCTKVDMLEKDYTMYR